MGRCSRSAVQLTTVLFTHAHIDHLGGIATHSATRELWGLPPARYVVPPAVVPGLERLMDAWRGLDGARFDGEIYPLEPGDSLALTKELTVTALRTVHRVVSQAYVISKKRKKLRSDLVGLSGPEIAARRTAGEEVHDIWEVDELAFSGDTRMEGLTEHERILASRRLLMEVTFFDDRVSVEMARKMGHIHFDEFVRDGGLFKNEQIVLTHRSARYRKAEALALIEQKLPPELAGRVRSL